MKTLRILLLASAMTACTHNEKEVHEIDTKNFVAKGTSQDGQIGINGKKEAVIRSNSAAQDELAVLDLTNTHLRDEVERELADFKACSDQLNDQRLGGNGRTTTIPDLDKLKVNPEAADDMGVDEKGDLRVTHEENFAERLRTEKKYSETLKRIGKTAKAQRETCERSLTLAREQHGLPGKRYQAKGYFTEDGTWVETTHGEQNLEDAFEIGARAKDKAKTHAD